MPELWTNNARSALASSITDVAVSLPVTSGHGALFPSPTGGDYFYLTLEKSGVLEIVKCTARSTDTLTIIRAQQGTSAAAFAAGARVELRLTKQSLADLQSVGSVSAAYGSRPAAGVSGRLFLPSNGFAVDRDTGSAWAPWGPLFPFTAPVDGDFAWINQGGASVSVANGGIFMSVPADASRNFRIRKKAAPSAPYTITAWFVVTVIPNTTNASLLFGFRQSSDGKLANFAVVPATIASQKNTDHSNFSANYSTAAYNSEYTLRLICLRIADDNTNRILSLSNDGQNFLPFHSVGRTDFLTANEVFWGGDAESASAAMGIALLSWKEA